MRPWGGHRSRVARRQYWPGRCRRCLPRPSRGGRWGRSAAARAAARVRYAARPTSPPSSWPRAPPATPTTGPTATPTTEPSATPTVAPPPGTPGPVLPDVARNWTVDGGQVSASCRGQQITLLYATPQDGWAVETKNAGPAELLVEFGLHDSETTLRAWCANGTPQMEVGGTSDGAGSGSD